MYLELASQCSALISHPELHVFACFYWHEVNNHLKVMFLNT